MAKNTSLLKERLSNLRNDILCDIFKELQERKNMKIKFTETEAPRFYYDGGWRDITQLSIGFMSLEPISFGWHDERCSNSGTNAVCVFITDKYGNTHPVSRTDFR